MLEVGKMAVAVTRPLPDPLCLPTPRSGDTPQGSFTGSIANYL
jgi:hypothetical protein